MAKKSSIKKILYTSGIVLCFLTGCNFFTPTMSDSYFYIEEGVQRTFYALTFTENTQTQTTKTATCIAASKNLGIFVENRIIEAIERTKIAAIADAFEKHYETLITVYGSHTDVDKNGKLILLVYDMLTPTAEGGAYIAGYFNPNDLYYFSQSNRGDIIYINSFLVNKFETPAIMETVFHEMQHAINANRSVTNNKYLDLWLNEALSESTSFVYSAGSMNANRLKNYNTDESVRNGSYFYTWRDSGISSYATASLFMYWLYAQNGGNSIFTKIAQSAHSDYKAVVEAAKTFSSCSSWDTLLGTWLIANYKGESSGLHGYKGKLAQKAITVRQADGGLRILSPGDAIYTTSTAAVPKNGLSSQNAEKNGTTWKVIYNPSTAKNGGGIEITLSQSDLPAIYSATARTSAENKKPHYSPIDFVLPLETGNSNKR